MKKNVRRGFTLPEILVTVTVVAVLAAVVVPAVTQFINKGDAPAIQQDLNTIRQAITSYVSDNRTYPTTFYDLEVQNGSLTATWKGPYTNAPLTGATGTGTFTSGSGLNVTLGPTISAGSGYVTTTLTFVSAAATCQDLWNLDKAIDGGTGSNADAVAMSLTGNLVFGTPCNVTTNGSSLAGSSATLRLMTIGK